MASKAAREPMVRIAVFGKSGCGKTTFINAFYIEQKTDYPVRWGYVQVYPVQFSISTGMKRAVIYEFQCDRDTYLLVSALQKGLVNCIVLMYAIDDPSSFQRVIDTYRTTISGSNGISVPVSVLVGSKSELRDDLQVIQRLACENIAPVTYAQGRQMKEACNIGYFIECSSDCLILMSRAVYGILEETFAVLHGFR